MIEIEDTLPANLENQKGICMVKYDMICRYYHYFYEYAFNSRPNHRPMPKSWQRCVLPVRIWHDCGRPLLPRVCMFAISWWSKQLLPANAVLGGRRILRGKSWLVDVHFRVLVFRTKLASVKLVWTVLEVPAWIWLGYLHQNQLQVRNTTS